MYLLGKDKAYRIENALARLHPGYKIPVRFAPLERKRIMSAKQRTAARSNIKKAAKAAAKKKTIVRICQKSDAIKLSVKRGLLPRRRNGLRQNSMGDNDESGPDPCVRGGGLPAALKRLICRASRTTEVAGEDQDGRGESRGSPGYGREVLPGSRRVCRQSSGAT